MARITPSDLKRTGNDFVRQVQGGRTVKPGKGNCPAPGKGARLFPHPQTSVMSS